MSQNAFQDSRTLAIWSASTLKHQGLDEIAKWRMLEYWIQVELFRAIQAGQAGLWRHVGDYEHPYHTELPRSGSKTKTKWIDMVLAEPDTGSPESVVWIELKHIGRNEATLLNNAKGLGHDLAALWGLSPHITRKIWLNPPAHVIDRGRVTEWNRFGTGLGCKNHLISQIAICPKRLSETAFANEIEKPWIQTFESRVKRTLPLSTKPFEVCHAETDSFYVFALVGKLGQ